MKWPSAPRGAVPRDELDTWMRDSLARANRTVFSWLTSFARLICRWKSHAWMWHSDYADDRRWKRCLRCGANGEMTTEEWKMSGLTTYTACNKLGEPAVLTWYKNVGDNYWTHSFRVYASSGLFRRGTSGGIMFWDPWSSTEHAIASSASHINWKME